MWTSNLVFYVEKSPKNMLALWRGLAVVMTLSDPTTCQNVCAGKQVNFSVVFL